VSSVIGGPIEPRRFRRPDGAIVAVMQWNADSKPAVVNWLLRLDVDFHVHEDPNEAPDDWDTRLLVIHQADGDLTVAEDELIVRERRKDGDRWTKIDRETWATTYEPTSP